MTQYSKMILIFMIILLPMGTFLAIYASKASTADLVVNGGFEDGMNG